MVEQLRARPLVCHVHLNASEGCLIFDHEHDDPRALIARIQHDLHGWELADNGERVMVDLAVHEDHSADGQGRSYEVRVSDAS